MHSTRPARTCHYLSLAGLFRLADDLFARDATGNYDWLSSDAEDRDDSAQDEDRVDQRLRNVAAFVLRFRFDDQVVGV